MDIMNILFSEDNIRTLLLLVAVFVAFTWQTSRLEKTLRKEMNELGVSLRKEMDALAASLRKEMDERFVSFHKLLKENDFAHLNRTIKALTFILEKNKIIEPMRQAVR